jgi:dihydropteroate synthase
VIDAIHKSFPDAVIALDTYKSKLAKRAIESGVSIINDVTAGRGDEAMFEVIAGSKTQYVLMYSKDETPRTTIEDKKYGDVVKDVKAFLKERIIAAVAADIALKRIILDPGMGHFVSSDPYYSFDLLKRIKELEDLGCPILVSPSRKSFLSGEEKLSPRDRLPGTIVASAFAVINGASYIRTHDVADVRRGCEVAIQLLP